MGARSSQVARIGTVGDAHATVAVGIGLARLDLVTIAAKFCPEGDLDGRAETEVGRAGEVEVVNQLGEEQAASVETVLAAGPDGGVSGVGDGEAELVGTPDRANVPVPGPGLALEATTERIVDDVGIDLRKEAVRVNRADRAIVAGAAEEAGRLAVALGGATEEIGGDAAIHRQLGVHEETVVPGLGIALPVVEAIDGGLARVEGVGRVDRGEAGAEITIEGIERPGGGHAAEVLLAGIGQRAVGAAAVAGEDRCEDEAVLAERGAVIGGGLTHNAIALLGETIGGVETVTHGAVEHHIQHAGDGIGSILCRSAVTEHLDAPDSGAGDGVEVDRNGAAADEAVHVHQRAGVAALAVDEQQRLVGREAAQCGRTNVVRAVTDRGARKIEGGHQRLEHLGRLGVPAEVEVEVREHVDRHDRLGDRTRIEARAGGDDRVELHDFTLAAGIGGRGLGTDQRGADGKRGHRKEARSQETPG